ncbi:MAG TPA: biotin/lipoyl-containing protein, partial [Flavisolibacter sp.]|nr:biotin/lipoyl-containing protein [Flavisolibacter sp.]
MATVDLVMPKMGESIMEATILKWHKQPGDAVKMDETVLEIATDKVDSEVPSTAEGVIEALLYNVNDVVPIGTVIARIKTGAEQGNQSSTGNGQQASVQNAAPSANTSQQPTVQQPTPPAPTPNLKPQTPNQNRFYSPLVLNIAA